MNTTVWLISYTSETGPRSIVHTHNAVADYREIDPAATSVAIDCAAVAELIAASEASLKFVEARAKVHCVNAHERVAMERHRAALAACKELSP